LGNSKNILKKRQLPQETLPCISEDRQR
jgi:hypothetical protein